MGLEIDNRISDSIKDMRKYTPGKGEQEISEKFDVDDVVKLSSNENPQGCALAVEKFLQEKNVNYGRYPDGECRELREELADFYNVDYEQIVVGNGSDEIIDFALELVVSPGDEVIMAEPSFSQYELSTLVKGAEPVQVPLDEEYKHDLDAMLEAVSEKTRVVFICDPNNPTGTIVPGAEVKEFLEQLRDDILVVIDQAYYEYVESSDYFRAFEHMEEHPNLLIMRTFSKIFGLAGLRVGYGIGNPEVIEAMHRIRKPFNVNSIAQSAAIKALNCRRHLYKCRQINNNQRNFFEHNLEELGIEYIPSQANFILINTEMPAEEAFKHFASRGIVVRTADSFGLDQWIRLTLPPNKYTDRVLDALKDLKEKISQVEYA